MKIIQANQHKRFDLRSKQIRQRYELAILIIYVQEVCITTNIFALELVSVYFIQPTQSQQTSCRGLFSYPHNAGIPSQVHA